MLNLQRLLPVIGLSLLMMGCANSSAKLVTEVRYVKALPPVSLTQCPVPVVQVCGADQDCVADDLTSVSDAWSECHANSVALKRWSSGEKPLAK